MTSYRDWVVETSSTTGTGSYALSGSAPAGTSYFTFRQRYSNGEDKVVYWVVNADRTKWEKNRFGTLTYGSPDTLSRNVVESTNGDAPVSWVGGDLPLRIYVVSDSVAQQLAIENFHDVAVQKFTGSGTYTPNAKMVWCKIETWGGGGGGGGTATANANVGAGGAGGGAGGYSIKYATAADIGVSKTVTIGAAGTGGTSGNNAGGAGGDTSVDTLCIGKGGTGGGGSDGSSTTGATPGAGGVAGTGDVTSVGSSGHATTPTGGNAAFGRGGDGGDSTMGSGGRGPLTATTTAGTAGTGRASGGSGGTSFSGGGAAAGGAGTAGYVVITEYLKG